MNRRRVGTSLYAGFLFAVLGAVAWASGQPFIFPSLGPSALEREDERRGAETREDERRPLAHATRPRTANRNPA